MPKTAISFNVPPKLWDTFKKQTDALFLSRAPFLDHMIAEELTHLRRDLDGFKLSLRAKRHIAGAMKRQGPTSVNIEVRPETAEALREAVTAHNLVRDAFMARLIIFLRSTDNLLDFLGVPAYTTGVDRDTYLEQMPSSPLGALEAVRGDPLFYVRSNVEKIHSAGIYTVQLPRQFDWAACYLANGDIEGTAAHRRKKKTEDEYLANLDEALGFKPTTKGRTKK